MKSNLLSLILVIAASVLSCARSPEPLSGVIDFIAGTVTVTEGGTVAAARVGDRIGSSAVLRTDANSFVQISIGGNQVQVYEKSTIILGGLARGDSGENETLVRVGAGTILSRVKHMASSRGGSFTVTSCVMVAAVRGTEFLYSTDCSQGMVATFEGLVEVRTVDGEEVVMVPAGQVFTLEQGAKGTMATVPARFRHRDFEYGKNAYMPGGASRTTGTEGARESGGTARGEQGTYSRTAAADRSAVPSAEKEHAGSARKGESGTGSTERTAVKGKDAGATATKKTGSAQKNGAVIVPAGRTYKPGALLDKPRVSIPEL